MQGELPLKTVRFIAGVVAQACNPGTQEVDTRGSRVQAGLGCT
jgi:hypothetical protein